MKKIFVFLLLVTGIILCSGCNIPYKKVECTGEVETKVYSLEKVTESEIKLDIHDIMITDGNDQYRPKLEVSAGEKQLSITCQTSLFSDLKLYQTNDKIEICAKENTRYITNDVVIKISGYTLKEIDLAFVDAKINDSFTSNRLEIDLSGISVLRTSNISASEVDIDLSGVSKIYCEKIDSPAVTIEVSGVSSVETLDITSDNAEIDVSGSSIINLNVDISQRFDLEISGASKANVTGKVNYLKLSLSSASKFEGEYLEIIELKCNISGASKAIANVSKKVSGNVTGASTLKLKGKYKEYFVDVSDSSKVERE